MLADDAGLEIWSQYENLARGGGDEAVYLEDCSDETYQLLVEALPYNDYASDLSDAIREFSKLLTEQLILFGRVHFDLQLGWEPQAEQRLLRKARLSYVYADSLISFGPWVFQVVPPGTYGGPPSGEVVRLDRGHLVVFEPPRRWRKAIAIARRGLPLVGRSENLWMHQSIRGTRQEDFKTVHRAYITQVARLTSAIGWNVRAPFRSDLADFHWMLRELRWRRFCIEMRDIILTGLRRVFLRIGALRGETPRLAWRGLPTVQQVDEAEARMMAGGCRFTELLATLQASASRAATGG